MGWTSGSALPLLQGNMYEILPPCMYVLRLQLSAFERW
jgi:hypothetical protein